MAHSNGKKQIDQRQLDLIDNAAGLGLLVVSIIVSLIAIVLYLNSGFKTVYVYIFFLPLVISGIMYHKSAVYVGLLLGLTHVVVTFVKTGTVSMDALIRMTILIVSAVCVRYLTKAIDEKQRDVVINNNTLKQVLESIGDGVIAVDRNKRVILMNKTCERLTGWDSSEAEGRDVSEILKMVHENENYYLQDPIAEALRTKMIYSLDKEIVLVSRNGERTYVEGGASPISDEGGEVVGAVMTLSDVTKKRADLERIKYLGFHDPLTGLYNRRFLNEEMERMDSTENYPISIIIGDIDNLKLINDAFGHSFGDNVLVQIAKTIKKHVRKHDVAVRSGGGTFAVIMTNTDMKTTEKKVGEIEKACSKIWTENQPLSITFGWNSRLSADEEIEKFYKRAEDHMYKRKLNNLPSVRGRSIQTSMNLLFIKSPREKMHSERVSLYCAHMAKELGMDDRDIEDLKTVSLLHDIGKIIISEAVLEKKGKLSPDEWIEMKRHPMIGYRIVRDSLESKDLAIAIMNHHERWDGKGYPQGLKGDKINFYARIISIADSYDAMISERPYKKAMTEEEAAKEVLLNAGKQFDPNLARIFVKKVLKKS